MSSKNICAYITCFRHSAFSSTWLDNFLCSDHLEKLIIIDDLQMIDFDVFFYCCQYAPIIPVTMCLFFQLYMAYAYGYNRNTILVLSYFQIIN